MAKYRKIDPRIWNDAKFRALSDDGKLLFLFLLTHPQMTALGAMRASVATLSDELEWLPERLTESLSEGLAKGMVRHDPKARFLSLPNWLKYNKPESPNVITAWANAVDMVPECDLKYQLWQDVKAFVEGYSKGFQEAFRKAFPEPFAKAIGNQEQEQEQEQKQEQEQQKTTQQPAGERLTGGPDPAKKPSSRGVMAKQLREAGVVVTSAHPTLVAWVDDGIDVAFALECLEIVRRNKPQPEQIPANYLDAVIRGEQKRQERGSNETGKHSRTGGGEKLSAAEQAEQAEREFLEREAKRQHDAGKSAAGSGKADHGQDLDADESGARTPLEGQFQQVGNQ